MDFGVTFQTDPPAAARGRADAARRGARLRLRVDVRLAHPVAGAVRHLRADAGGDRADHGRAVRHQPGDARPTVTASLFATLNEGFGNRTICGIGRGDSARRVLGKKPTTLAADRGGDPRHQGARRGPLDRDARRRGVDPVGARRQARRVDGGLRAEGARARRAQGRRVHPPARRPGDPALDGRARARGRRGGRPRPGRDRDLRRGAGLPRRRPRPRARPVPLVRRDGRQPRRRPRPPLRRGRRHPRAR